tara:strand:- start:1052 stop:1738 length:687 start_codon:yes stop_codon:yes gene_type:complete
MSKKINKLGESLLEGQQLYEGAQSLYNIGSTASSYLSGSTAATALETAALTSGGTSTIAAAMPGAGLAVMLGAYAYGVAEETGYYRDLIPELEKGIEGMDTLLTSGATDLRYDIENVQNITADKVTRSTIAAGQKLSGQVSGTLGAATKKHGGIKTGDIETTKKEITESIEDTMNVQKDILLSETDMRVEAMGESWESNVAAAGVEIEQMREELSYAKKHDEYLDNIF